MKKYFNIKILIISVFAFICFFMVNEKVEAIQCRYNSIGESTYLTDGFTNLYDNYQIELSNDSGSTKLSIYDIKNKKKIDLSESTAKLDDLISAGYLYRYAGNISDISLENTCPTTLYSFSNVDYTTGNQAIAYYYYTDKQKCYNKGPSSCEGLSLTCTDCYGKVSNAYNNCIKDGVSEKICKVLESECFPNNNEAYCRNQVDCLMQGNKFTYCIKKRVSSGGCVYATYDDAKENKAKDNHFSLYLNDLSIPQSERVGNYAGYNMNVGFKKEDLIDPSNCPNDLYLNRNDTQYTVNLYASGNDSSKLGLLKTSVVSHDKNTVINVDDICDKLEGTKTLEWIKRIYTLLKFLVPTLIIVLSVIDFLGIVLSGDSDKMEKAKNKFIKRIIIGVIFILLPFILEFVLRMAGIIDKSLTDVVCRIIK